MIDYRKDEKSVIVKGCSSCPFLDSYNMPSKASGYFYTVYSCKIDKNMEVIKIEWIAGHRYETPIDHFPAECVIQHPDFKFIRIVEYGKE